MAKIDKLLENAKPHLHTGETVLAAVVGSYEVSILGSNTVRSGVLFATPTRLVFYAKKLGGYDLESFAYDKISSLEQGKSMMGHHIAFFASGNKVQMKWISDLKAMEAFVSVVRERLGTKTPPTPPTPPAPPVSTAGGEVAEKIKQLASLHAAGILTDEEFTTKKAELLAQM